MQQANEWIADGIDPAEASVTRRGSADRVDVYAARYEAGLPMWHADDSDEAVTVEEKAADMQHEASRRIAADARTALTRWAHAWLVEAAVEAGVDLDASPPGERCNLAQWIRRRREKLGLEPRDLARRMKISVKDINRYEAGIYLPEQKTVDRLSTAFSSGIRVDEPGARQ